MTDRQAIIEKIAILEEAQRRGLLNAQKPIKQASPEIVSFQSIQGLLNGLRPEPDLTVTQWADRYRMLGSIAAAEPGRYRSEKTPYAIEPMDSLSPSSPYRIVVAMKGAQVGFSEIGFNWIGYCIHLAPGPILIVNPTDQTMQDNSKLRIAPMIEATPVLAERISAPKSRGSENSILFKLFPGGVLRMVGSNSAPNLRSMPARYAMIDEYDGFPDNVDDEGSPLKLVMKRMDTFGSRAKLFIISTPTTATSKIAAEFAKTDQRHYHVPCPHCGDMEPLEWERVRWEKIGEVFNAWMHCDACGFAIEERNKTWMLANGKWVAHFPERANPEKVGYHLSGLYSPLGWFSWANAVEAYVEAYETKNDSNLKRAFRNTVLGLTFEEDQERPPYEWLMENSGKYERNQPPQTGPQFITCGIDVQRDRLELEIVAWGVDKESWSIDYRVIRGDTSQASNPIWSNLEALMRETWSISGVQMPIAWTAIDSSDQTTVIYDVVAALAKKGLRILAVKGRAQQLIDFAKGGLPFVDGNGKKFGRPFYLVGVNILKSELYGFLRLERHTDGTAPAGFCHFPKYGEDYFKSLTAEAIVVEVDRLGKAKEVWKKIHPRNEALDCRNYARAVAAFGGMIHRTEAELAAMRAALGGSVDRPTQRNPDAKAPTQDPRKTKPKKPSIWDR